MRVLVATGGSGGHLFPAISFLDALGDYPGVERLLVAPRNALTESLPQKPYCIRLLALSSLDLRVSTRHLRALWKFLCSFFISVEILARFKPDVVVGFGSYASVGVVFLAWLFRIRTFIHEQNVIPGRANRLLGYFVDRIAISFKESSAYFYDNCKKVFLCGNPLRAQLRPQAKNKAREYFGLDAEVFTLLVIGGSQGSERLNRVVADYLSRIDDPRALQVVHLSGKAGFASAQEAYAHISVRHRVLAFCDEMQYAYSAADCALARAGAMTVSELAFFQLPALLVPYPYAHQHQLANAKALASQGGARVIEEAQLSVERLGKEIDSLARSPLELEKMRMACRGGVRENAAAILAREVMHG